MHIDLVVSPDLIANFAFGEKIMYRFSKDKDNLITYELNLNLVTLWGE